MIKKIYYIFIYFSLTGVSRVFADVELPDSMGLPDFKNRDEILGGAVQTSTANPHGFLTKTIAEGIKYVGLLAVVALTVGGIMYMVSYGNDSKTKKAKYVIIYAIVGVGVSILAYSLVDMINSLTIG